MKYSYHKRHSNLVEKKIVFLWVEGGVGGYKGGAPSREKILKYEMHIHVACFQKWVIVVKNELVMMTEM